jgi:putative redox protein
MVQSSIVYQGNLRCHITHLPSGETITTDAPKDNQGLGASFSPTDMLAAALGSCMMTIMGIAARTHAIPLDGTSLIVTKEMTATPPRKIQRLTVEFTLPQEFDEHTMAILHLAARTCPVSLTLGDNVEIITVWNIRV